MIASAQLSSFRLTQNPALLDQIKLPRFQHPTYAHDPEFKHILAVVIPSILREFIQHHDITIREAVASVLDLRSLTERDTLLMEKKTCNHWFGLRRMEGNLEFLFLAGFMPTAGTIQNLSFTLFQ